MQVARETHYMVNFGIKYKHLIHYCSCTRIVKYYYNTVIIIHNEHRKTQSSHSHHTKLE